MTKYVEVKSYEHLGVNVIVEIDYEKKVISLVDKNEKYPCDPLFTNPPRFIKKRWIFAERGPEYLQGWLNILDAMKLAIEQANDELKQYLAEKQEERDNDTTEILIKATEMVKKHPHKRKIKIGNR